MSSKPRIGVLLGGLSGQRDLSMRAGEAILGALAEQGHEAQAVFVDRDLDLSLRQARIDLAFLALRGRYGGDGCVQGVLELLGIPYTGSGVLASSLAMNKAKTKEVLRLHNLPTAPAYVIRAEDGADLAQGHGSFGYPVVVRPVGAGPGVGVSLARDEVELEAAVEEALRYDDEVLVERFVDGRVLSVGVLDGTALGATELGASSLLLGRPETGPLREARGRLSVARYRSLLRLAVQAYEAVGCEGPALVDLVVTEKANEVVMDIDAAPALLPGGLFPRIAQGAGLGFGALCEQVLGTARLRAHGRRRERRALQLDFGGPERRAGVASVAH
jgi:D-alanine-D-alanine ligase